MKGKQGSDYLYGGQKDTLIGNAGENVLQGEQGADALNGGNGKDILFENGDDTLLVAKEVICSSLQGVEMSSLTSGLVRMTLT